MITSELRNKNGEYKSKKIKDLNQAIKKDVSKIYKKHKGKVSYDTLHLLISDASFTERILNIAINSCDKT